MDKPILTWTNAYPNPPYINIPTGRPAPWTHSPVFIHDGTASAQNSPTAVGFYCSPAAQIVMSGNRRDDRLNFLANFNDWDLDGFDFHHTYSFGNAGPNNSTCDGQMVLRRNHNTSKPHTGAVKQYEEAFHAIYRLSYDELISSPEYAGGGFAPLRAPLAVSDGEFNRFASRNKLEFPSWLAEVYAENASLSPYWKTGGGYVETMQDIAPLADRYAWDCSVEFLLSLPHIQAKLAELGDAKAVPFAFDPCGNVFVATGNQVFLFDDECDRIEEVNAVG